MPRPTGGKQTVPHPVKAPRALPLTTRQLVIPALLVTVILGMIVVIMSQPGLRSGVGMFSFLLPVMMIGAFAASFNRGGGGGENQPKAPQDLAEDRRVFYSDLDESRDEVQESARLQFEHMRFLNPAPNQLRGLIGSPRMWERSGTGDPARDPMVGNFCVVRMGTGRAALIKKLSETHISGDRADYDPVTLEAHAQFELQQTHINNAPMAISLTKHPLITLAGDGDNETLYGVVRAMICQSAVLHPPTFLKIAVVTNNLERWDDIKWLPHCQHHDRLDQGGAMRLIWSSAQEMAEAVGVTELGTARKNFGTSGATELPHWLVFNDVPKVDSDWDALTRKGAGGVAGVTFVRVVTKKESSDDDAR
jgi:S-DNA-T family DNA segregation ATPase FtsK/SpoIIIE